MKKFIWIALFALISSAFAQDEILFSEAGMYPGENSNPLDPNSHVTLTSLQQLLQPPTVQSRVAPMDQSKPAPFNPITSDYEMSLFHRTALGMAIDGQSHSIRAAWGRTMPDGSVSYGARGTAQALFLEMGPGMSGEFLNWSAGGFYEKVLVRRMDKIASYGGSLDLLLYGDAMASEMMQDSRFGANAAGYARGTIWKGIHRITGGGSLQLAYLGRFQQINLLLGSHWLANLHPAFDSKVEVLFRSLLLQNDSQDLIKKPLNRSEMHLGLGGAWYLSKSFALDLSYRTALLLDDLRIHTFQVGSRFAF